MAQLVVGYGHTEVTGGHQRASLRAAVYGDAAPGSRAGTNRWDNDSLQMVAEKYSKTTAVEDNAVKVDEEKTNILGRSSVVA